MFNVSTLTNLPLTGPRSILRVVQVFAKLAAHPDGQTLTQQAAPGDLTDPLSWKVRSAATG